MVDPHSGHTTSARAALREEWDGNVGERGIVPTPESMDKEAKAETEREEVRKAVDATWASAKKMQEQAVATAASTSVRLARDQYEAELKLALQEQEARLRAEAEEAIGKIWETAKREKTKAVEDALAQYAEEKAALSGTREKEQADLDAAYQALKGEVSRVLEAQHAKNLTDAVNTTWERAAVQEEKAVAQALTLTLTLSLSLALSPSLSLSLSLTLTLTLSLTRRSSASSRSCASSWRSSWARSACSCAPRRGAP